MYQINDNHQKLNTQQSHSATKYNGHHHFQ